MINRGYHQITRSQEYSNILHYIYFYFVMFPTIKCTSFCNKILIKKLTTFKNPTSSQVEVEMITTNVELKETEVSKYHNGP